MILKHLEYKSIVQRGDLELDASPIQREPRKVIGVGPKSFPEGSGRAGQAEIVSSQPMIARMVKVVKY